MADQKAFTLELRDDQVAVIHINGPGESMNS